MAQALKVMRLSEVKGRRQTLHDMENEIKNCRTDTVELFFRIGTLLGEIRNRKLYQAEGFETWEQYAKAGRLLRSQRHADRLIKAAEYRKALPDAPAGENWTESIIRDLTRLGTPGRAKRIAEKAIKHCKKTGDSFPASVRRLVKRELPKPKTSGGIAPSLDEYLVDSLRECRQLYRELRQIPADSWNHIQSPTAVSSLSKVIENLSSFLERKI